jgi:3-oxoacyl-[acyl-carrier-protein] synthase II
MDAAIKYALTAGKKALRAAGLPHDAKAVPGDGGPIDAARAGILVGTAMGGMATFAGAVEDWATKGYRRMNPFCIPFAITNMPGAQLAMDTGFMGPNYSISTACATGNYCLLAAADHIRRGDADLMLAGGTDAAVIPSGIGGFTACKALSQRNADPAGASRPWDTGRDGFVMGEGAGVLVLESEAHAKARGATILAELAGGAVGCDAHHMTEPRPDGAGVAACITAALAASGVAPGEVDYVNAHATSTPAGDLAEWRAIRAAVPGDRVKVNATKSLIGHLLGAASAVEAVAAVQAIRTGWLHPTLNVDSPDPLIELDRVVLGEKLAHDTRVALSNSFGFGGHNSCVVFKRWEE